MPTHDCTPQLLAKGRTCRITRCSHGTLHVTLGALTLRLTESQLQDLAATLAAAGRGLRCEVDETPAERMLC